MKTKLKKTIEVVMILSFLLFLPYIIWDLLQDKQSGTGSPTPDVGAPVGPRPDPMHNVDKLLEGMDFGAIAFNAPININVEDSHLIQLILSLSDTSEKLKKEITEEGEKIGAKIRVTDRMEARLSGYMFQITAITPEIQAVSKGQRTEWNWEIHPKEEGQHRLHLTLTALLEINGRNTPRTIRTFRKVVEVNVTPSQKVGIFFTNNWQWLWAAILVPIAGWLWKRRKIT